MSSESDYFYKEYVLIHEENQLILDEMNSTNNLKSEKDQILCIVHEDISKFLVMMTTINDCIENNVFV